MNNEIDPLLAKFLKLRGIEHPPPEQAQAANEAARSTIAAAVAASAFQKRFCANPKCQLHDHPYDSDGRVTVLQNDRLGNPYPVTRTVGRSILRAGPREIGLCHVCSEAVKMAINMSAKPER